MSRARTIIGLRLKNRSCEVRLTASPGAFAGLIACRGRDITAIFRGAKNASATLRVERTKYHRVFLLCFARRLATHPSDVQVRDGALYIPTDGIGMAIGALQRAVFATQGEPSFRVCRRAQGFTLVYAPGHSRAFAPQVRKRKDPVVIGFDRMPLARGQSSAPGCHDRHGPSGR